MTWFTRLKDLERRVEMLEQEALHREPACRHGRVRDDDTFAAPVLTCLDCRQRVPPQDVPDDAEVES